MNKIQYLIFIILIGLSSCKGDIVEDQVRKHVGKQFCFQDLNIPCYIQDVSVKPDFADADFKIVCFVDSAGCTPCNMKLRYWDRVIEYFNRTVNANTVMVMIVQARDADSVTRIMKQEKFPHYVFIDTVGNFGMRCGVSDDESLKSYLLDSDNTILAVGNPVLNDGIKRFFADIMNGTRSVEYGGEHGADALESAINGSQSHIMAGTVKNGESVLRHINIFNTTTVA